MRSYRKRMLIGLENGGLAIPSDRTLVLVLTKQKRLGYSMLIEEDG